MIRHDLKLLAVRALAYLCALVAAAIYEGIVG